MSKVPIAVFTADNHLRPTVWAKHPEIRGDAYYGFNCVVDYCVRYGVPLLQLGDLFDSKRPDSESVMFYQSAVERLAAAGLACYFVQGNHDYTEPSWATSHPAAVPATREFGLSGIKFVGLDYTPPDRLPEAIAGLPATDFVLTHQSWRELQPIGRVDGSLGLFPHGIKLLTGDYHVTDTFFGKAASGGDVVAYSPGATAVQRLDESPEKAFGVVFDDASVAFVSFPSRAYAKVVVKTENDLTELITKGPAEHLLPRASTADKPVLRVRYPHTIAEAHDRIVAAFVDEYHLFIEPQIVSDTTVIDMRIEKETAYSALGDAVSRLTVGWDDAEARDIAVRIISSVDPVAEVAAVTAEMENQIG